MYVIDYQKKNAKEFIKNAKAKINAKTLRGVVLMSMSITEQVKNFSESEVNELVANVKSVLSEDHFKEYVSLSLSMRLLSQEGMHNDFYKVLSKERMAIQLFYYDSFTDDFNGFDDLTLFRMAIAYRENIPAF